MDESCTSDGCEHGDTELTLSKADDKERETDDGVRSDGDEVDAAGAGGVDVVAGVRLVR